MRIKIDFDLCQGHGECEMEAPEIFRVVSPSGEAPRVELILDSPPTVLRGKLEAAVRMCPNRVLSIDPEE